MWSEQNTGHQQTEQTGKPQFYEDPVESESDDQDESDAD